MRELKLLALTFFLLASFTTLFILAAKEGKTNTLISKTGCCSITTTHYINGNYYIIYTDNLAGTEALEVETTPQDADHMINTFQEYCLEHHPINQNY